MADASTNITSLSIGIEASSGKAASKITRIADALRSLNTALTAGASSELSKLVSGIQLLADAKTGVGGVAAAIKQVSERSSGAAKSVDTLATKVERLSTNMETATDRADKFATSIKNVGEATASTKMPLADHDYTEVLGRIAASLKAIQNSGGSASRKLKETTESVSKTASAAREAEAAVDPLVEGMKRLGKAIPLKALQIGGTTLKLLGKSVLSFWKGIGKFMKPKGFGALEKLLRSIGRIAFYRLIRTLMKTITQGFKEGIENLYHYSELVGTKFKSSMDKMATSALYVKNAFAAMAAPLINVVAPIIDMIGDKIAALANKMAEFFAALTGQRVYTKAIKYAKDYNDELKETAKQMERWLAPFDEINRMNDKSGGGNADAVDYSKMFEEAIVSDEMSRLAQMIIEAFEKADLSPIGRALGEKLKAALDSINWTAVKKKAAKLAKMLTSLINGALSVKGLGKSIGKTIAEVLNTAVTFASTFVSTLDWKTLGQQIGQAARTFITTFGFEDVGTAAYTLAKGILTTLQEAVNEVGAINPATGLSGWEEFGKRIADALANAKVGDIIATTVKLGWSIVSGILKASITFLKESEKNGFWEELGTGIGEALRNVNWAELIGNVIEIGSGIIKGIFTSIKKAFSTATGLPEWTADLLIDAGAVFVLGKNLLKLLNNTRSVTKGFGGKNDALSQQTQLTEAETSAVTDMSGALDITAAASIPAVVGALGILYQTLKNTKSETKTTGDTVTNVMSSVSTAVQTGTSAAAASIQSAMGTATSSVAAGAASIAGSLAPVTNAATNTVPYAFQSMNGAINKYLGAAWKSMQKFNNGISVIPKNFKGMTDDVAANLEISGKNEEKYVKTESENWAKYNNNRVSQTLEAAKKIRQANTALQNGGALPAALAASALAVLAVGALARGRGGQGAQAMSTWEGYDSGGFPSAGSLFLAGEGKHSPEYVGTFGGQTGVWNSDQLVTAMYRAVSSALANMPQQGGDIYLDGEIIYRNVVRRNNNHVRSTGRAALLT